MHRAPLILIVLGLALHFPGAWWHDFHHEHEGWQTLRTQAGFYTATAFVLMGGLLGLVRSTHSRLLQAGYGTVLLGAFVEAGGWAWDFAAHFSGDHSEAAHTLTYVGPSFAVLGTFAVIVLIGYSGGARR